MTKKIIKITFMFFLIYILIQFEPKTSFADQNTKIETIDVKGKVDLIVESNSKTSFDLKKETVKIEEEKNTKKEQSKPTTLEVWNKIAACESSGNWSANTGNGYYGGLQFSAQTWKSAGGLRFAPFPHQATREEQIEIAESWLKKTSWSQWSCSKIIGVG